MCHNLPGSYRCDCKAGFQQDPFSRSCIGRWGLVAKTPIWLSAHLPQAGLLASSSFLWALPSLGLTALLPSDLAVALLPLLWPPLPLLASILVALFSCPLL